MKKSIKKTGFILNIIIIISVKEKCREANKKLILTKKQTDINGQQIKSKKAKIIYNFTYMKTFTIKAGTFQILDEELFYKHLSPDIQKSINTLLAYNIIAPYQK